MHHVYTPAGQLKFSTKRLADALKWLKDEDQNQADVWTEDGIWSIEFQKKD